MSDCQLESRCHAQFSSWGALSAQVLSYNIHVSANIAEYWRHVAEIHVASVMAIAGARETPTDRRRKFAVIDGGKK
jgi:hypothetical protein